MSTTLSIEIYEILEEKLGKNEAKAFLKAVEALIDEISLKRKIETKEDWNSELATKADIVRLEGKIETIKIDIEWKLKLYFIILLFTIILVSPKAIDLIAKLLGVVK